jgi:short-subunit dehydrogenase
VPTTIVITGASQGLGEALALDYAATNVVLALHGRNDERLQQVADACRARGAIVLTHAGDVTQPESMRTWLSEVHIKHPIDLVIANAGISGGTAGGVPESEAQVRQIFDVNVAGVFNTILPVIPWMQQRKEGHIALIGSIAGLRGLPCCPAYSASKASIKAFGEGLRGSLQPHNIAVTVVMPGYIHTAMTAVNQFPMPGIMPAPQAAAIIARRLQRKPARIIFPYRLYAMMRLLILLPATLSDWMVSKLPGKPPL